MLTNEQKQEGHARYVEICKRDVSWYRRFGQYRDRVRRDSEGTEYVIGDWSWHRLYPNRREYVDDAMPSVEQAISRHGVESDTVGIRALETIEKLARS